MNMVPLNEYGKRMFERTAGKKKYAPLPSYAPWDQHIENPT